MFAFAAEAPYHRAARFQVSPSYADRNTSFESMSWLADLVARNSPDPRARLELGAEIVNAVSEQRLPADSKILNDFCDLIVQWMSASNFKVSLLATQIASRSIDVSGDIISPYVVDRLRHFVERLGDSKANVRDATVDLLNDLSQTSNASPQVVMEKLMNELGHRQYMVKIGAMQVIKDIIDENRQLVENQVQKLIPTLCKLMADANSDVREMATSTLVTCCVNYGGDSVCHKIAANQRLPSAKLQLVKDRYKRTQNSAPATYVSGHNNQIPSTSRHSLPSITPRRTLARTSYNKAPMSHYHNGAADAARDKRLMGPPSSTFVSRASSVPAKSGAGAVSEDHFRQAFNDVPRKAVYDGRELASALETIRATLENTNLDWDKRVKAMKELRGLVNGGAMDFPEFDDMFRSLEAGIVTSIKDLRSQVCREGCITLAFLCEKMDRSSTARLTETMMPILISLMQNSAKVMASSGVLASSYVVKHSRNPKIIQLVIDALKHKSKEIRRCSLGLITDILVNWEPKITERSIGSIVEAIRTGLNDADAEARQKARVAYSELESKFNKQAMFLYQGLDASKQKMLHGQVSQSSSTHSVASEREVAQRAANYHAARSTSDINIGSARRVQQTPLRYGNARPAPVSAVRPPRNTASSLSAARPPPGTQRKILSAPTPQPSSKSLSQPGSRSTSPKRAVANKPRVISGVANGSPNRMYTPLKHNGRSLSGTNRAEMERALQAAFRNQSTESDSFEGAALGEAIRNCMAATAPQKKEGLKALQICLSQQAPLNSREAKRVFDALSPMFHERNTNMLGQYAQVFGEFLANYSELVVEFLPLILARLLPRIATEPLPSSKKYLKEVMANIVSSLPAKNQFLALCKHITDPTHTHGLAVKQLVLSQMRDVVKGVDASSVLLNTSECRLALSKIFHWMEDPKGGEQVRPYADQLFLEMFALNPSDLASLLSTVSTNQKDYVYDLLQDSKCAVAEEDSSNFNDDIRATTALINDFVITSNHRMHESSNSPPSMLSRERSFGTPTSRHSDFVDGPSTSMFNSRDHQTKLISDLCSIMHSADESADDKLQALGMLSQMTRDGSFTLWDDHFGQIIVVVIQLLKNSCGELKKAALRAIKDICGSQASRFNNVAEMTISGVLKAFNDPEAAVTRMAEECGATLATHLNVQVCLRVLLPVVNSASADPSAVSGAIKMIGKLLESVTREQVISMLPTVAPGIVETYNSDNSSIRRASVLVLVGIYNIVGDKLMPFMDNLNKTKLTLFEVYIKKVQNGTANLH
uniref:TOG domain-containing protein n=1 Tax=Steinernema glaseri TaxID=37863 RepID=A0A1I8AIJ0_9BILA